MEIPDIPDNRLHKKPSSLISHTPTVALDEGVQSDHDSQSGHFSQHLNTPPNEPHDYKTLEAFHEPARIEGDR